jgi:hypothetical protein
MRRTNKRSVFMLEGGHLRAADERCPGKDFLPARSHLVGYGRMLSAQVDKRN